MNQIRKRASSGLYKSLDAYRKDWQLMFSNARTYNQEGSWVYVDAEEMEKVFQTKLERLTQGSGLPGALSEKGEDGESTQMEEELAAAPGRGSKSSVRLNLRQVISDDEDDDYLSGNSDE